MVDPYIQEFQGRLRRVEKIHRRGGGFEAAGTLGRSYYTSAARKKSFVRPFLLTLTGAMLFKAFLLMQIGELDYRERVEALKSGTQVEVAGAYVMQADPITVWLANNAKAMLKAVF
ncbi:hypothetical protein [Actibacterium lipolyticum]|uniref:Uncharacterized protein n=1 Tax=Actibacterium lipolyticum TaxID=1524263 RepID=A0A238KPS3_9RHOB|nr:hypothetical protein [Actibacterium lipolyticum]SMX44102.1 hypothetical protein COL8621_02467 [Actibacterium lipolyticum]